MATQAPQPTGNKLFIVLSFVLRRTPQLFLPVCDDLKRKGRDQQSQRGKVTWAERRAGFWREKVDLETMNGSWLVE